LDISVYNYKHFLFKHCSSSEFSLSFSLFLHASQTDSMMVRSDGVWIIPTIVHTQILLDYYN